MVRKKNTVKKDDVKKTIILNESMRLDVLALTREINILQKQLNCLCAGYIRGQGQKGNYQLSKDLLSLQLVETENKK
jgi:hypothetical protein